MLIIYNEHKYVEFKKFQSKKNMKPSDYCKIELNFKNVKNYEFVKSYFTDVNDLIYSINEHKRLSNPPIGQLSLIDIMKSDK